MKNPIEIRDRLMLIGSATVVAGLVETGDLTCASIHPLRCLASILLFAGGLIVFAAMKMISIS